MTEKNGRIMLEISNNVYDVVSVALLKTSLKYNYGRYDIAKMVLAIYRGDFNYLTNDNDYREQVKLLDGYFQSRFGHRIITFEMVRMIGSFYGKDNYRSLVMDIINTETLIRTGKNVLPSENVFAILLEGKKYDELMDLIEKNDSMRYAVVIVYDAILNKIWG